MRRIVALVLVAIMATLAVAPAAFADDKDQIQLKTQLQIQDPLQDGSCGTCPCAD